MSTLRVLVPEHWPDPVNAAWVLLDKSNKLIGSGTSEPRHWPASERTEAVLMGAQISWYRVRVPRANAREQAKSIRFALEEQLVKDVVHQHITPTHKGAESWSVMVIEQERMKHLIAQFSAIGRPLDGMYGAVQTIPFQEGVWSIALHDQALWVRTAADMGFADDLDPSAMPCLLATAIGQARSNSTLPHTIRILATDIRSVHHQNWLEELGVPCESDEEWLWHDIPADAANLLQGDFATRHRDNMLSRQLKPALFLLAGLLLLHLMVVTVNIWVQDARLNTYKQEMVQVLKHQMPGISVQNPPAQLLRELNRQRTLAGNLADDEPLSILADFSRAAGVDGENALQKLHYETGSMTLSLDPKMDTASLIKRLAMYNISATPGKNEKSQLILKRVRP